MGEVKVQSHNMSLTSYRLTSLSFHVDRPSHSWVWFSLTTFLRTVPMRKKLATVTAHRELTVSSRWAHLELTLSSRWPKWSQPAVTEPWPGPWLSCDLAVTEPRSYWRCRDWAVTSPWLSCDLAVTELWPRRDWAVTSPSCDWAVIIGPGAVTTMVTMSSRWQFFLMGGHRGPYSLYKPRNYSLYIGIIIFPHITISFKKKGIKTLK